MQASGPGPDEEREDREDAAVGPARELPPRLAEQMPGPRFVPVRIPPPRTTVAGFWLHLFD
jgi:hypothetical protein